MQSKTFPILYSDEIKNKIDNSRGRRLEGRSFLGVGSGED
jgi:hypothetical protein